MSTTHYQRLFTNQLRRNTMNETIAQKLRKAYDLIANADTSDIDAYYLAVEEAHGYIAEALDLVDEGGN